MIPRSSISTFTDQSHQRRSRISPPSPPPPDNAAATPAALVAATFLARDIDDQDGERILLPSLSTKDRLRLSECCSNLFKYRYNLSRVKIRPHSSFTPNPNPSLRVALDKLLMDQSPRGGGLEYLYVAHRSLLGVLDLASKGCFGRLKTLHLGYWANPQPEDVGYMERALMGGGLVNLEELDIVPSLGGGVRRVLGALSQGACPRLRRLNLEESYGSVPIDNIGGIGDIGDAVEEALVSGHLHYLQELNLSGSILRKGGGAAFIRALQGGACPQVVKLCFSGWYMRAEDGQALGMAMRAGSCAKLEVMDLRSYTGLSADDECFVAIFGALEAGSCPNLKRLHLTDSAYLNPPGAMALGHALRSGNCHHLCDLLLNNAFSQPGASLHVLQAIRQGGRGVLPNLLQLDLGYNQFGQEHGQLLGEVIGIGAFPKLENLYLVGIKAWGDGDVAAVMAGLEGGGCRDIKKLDMNLGVMGPQGGQALGRALASDKLSCLRALMLDGNKEIGDEATKEIVVGLKRCHQLRKLGMASTGMGREAGGALVQALREDSWPQLKRLDLQLNFDLFEDEEVGRGLVEVLKDEKVQPLTHLDLNLKDSGLSMEVMWALAGILPRGCM